jgi:hypothetical protein
MHTARWLCLAALIDLLACSGKVSEGDEASRMSPSSVMASSGGAAPMSTPNTPPATTTPSTPRDAGMRQAPKDAGTRGAGQQRDAGSTSSEPGSLKLPPAGAGLDYQLGGAYDPPSGVKIVSRDRTAKPASGLYNICYVNGFQAQPDEEDFWMSKHPELVLRDNAGNAVIDQDWDELLLDTSSADKRMQLAEIIGGYIDGCAKSGFDAIEIDNLDSFSRSGGRLSEQNAIDFMALLSKRAHAAGLPIAQKNSSELVSQRAQLGTDFAVAEECNRYDECGDYTKGYGDLVLVIEYRRADFDKGCKQFPKLSMVLRDVDLTTPGGSSYVFDACP